MQAGKLRHLVTVQRPNPASPRDGAGQRLTAWIDVVVKEPASVDPITGRSEFLAAQRQASTTHEVTMRWSSATALIDASCRVLFGSRVLVLDGPPINVGERNRELKLECTEGLRTEN